ncbi:MAG TPA: hypothetical protein VMU69_20935 [Bradyrhizobium sp.]|nr:hypothetical protein [Bradyrhizobium sp.]
MKQNPLDQLRDRMIAAPDEINQAHLPPRFNEARAAFLALIVQLEAVGIPNETLVVVMLTQMLPRMVHQNGPEWTAATLAKLAHDIGAGASPAGMKQ